MKTVRHNKALLTTPAPPQVQSVDRPGINLQSKPRLRSGAGRLWVSIKTTMPALTSLRSLVIAALLCSPMSADPYKRQERVEGALLVFSSLEAMNAATLLLDGFKEVYPDIRISLEGPHSRSEANALLNGFANLTLTDKKLSDEYVKYFEDRHGTVPTSLVAFKDKDGREVSFGTVIYMPEDLDTIILEFMTFVYSDEGDAILRKANFTPLPLKGRQEQLAKLRVAENN